MTRSIMAGIVAVLLALGIGAVAVTAAPLLTAEPVPTCTKPTASNQTNGQQTNYIECRANRLEALVRNGYEPAPTVTETVTVTQTPSPTEPTEPTPTEPTPTSGACVKPSVDNTGPSGTLTSYPAGGVSTSQVIENRQVNGSLTIYADDVTIKNTTVTGKVLIDGADRVTLTNVQAREFDISSSVDVTMDKSEITGSLGDGMHFTSDGGRMNQRLKVTNSLIHNPKPGDGEHYDGLQVRGVQGLTVYCNNFDLGPAQFEYNAALYLEPANGGHSGVVIDDNWLFGGGYIFHYGADNDGATRLTDNHFGGDPYWGPNAACHNNPGTVPAVQTGNDLRGTPFIPCK